MIGPLGTEIQKGRRPVPSIQAVPPSRRGTKRAVRLGVDSGPAHPDRGGQRHSRSSAVPPTDCRESCGDPMTGVPRSGNDSGAEQGAPRTAAP